MLKIELFLRSQLASEALSSVLTAAGFSVLREREAHDDGVIALVEVDACKDPDVVSAHRLKHDKIVALMSEAEALEVDDDQIAPLSGILTDDLSVDAFVRSLRLICSGQRVFPCGPVPGPKLYAPPPGAAEPRPDGDCLSPREREVLSHLLEGHPNKVIARHLGTSEATVKVHLENLLRKIGVDNRTQAAIWALSNLPEFNSARRGAA